MSNWIMKSAVVAAMSAAIGMWAPAAVAQDCANPRCDRLLSTKCLERVGAGSVAVDDSCSQENTRYVACLREVAEKCGDDSGGGTGGTLSSGGGCTAEDARAEWARLEKSNEISELEVMAEFCKNTLQGRLAKARAERLKKLAAQGGGGGGKTQAGFTTSRNPSAPRDSGSTSRSDPTARAIQSELARLGYDRSPATGVWTASNADALRRYQRWVGSRDTGQPNARDLDLLRATPNRFLKGLRFEIYFRDTAFSRGEAEKMRRFITAGYGTVPAFDVIRGACSHDYIKQPGKMLIAYKPSEWADQLRFIAKVYGREGPYLVQNTRVVDSFAAYCHH